MLDFTSSLYLGLRHPSRMLGPWESLTAGAPAALSEPDDTRGVARALARLQGCERGVLAPSTLHLFWDLFGTLGRERVAVYMDAGVYPIARWGVERAAARGAPVQTFRHHDCGDLRRKLQRRQPGRRPIIVTDGFCPACGRPAPVEDYLVCARARGGLLVIDDTQALGILGHSPGGAAPYGEGGGGVLRWAGITGPDVVVVSSLAKGFGVPVAALGGSAKLVSLFEDTSETRVHCSQPSAPLVNAALRALRINAHLGEDLRQRLAGLVARFRSQLELAGFWAAGGLFPFQTLLPSPGVAAESLHARLHRKGVRTVLHKGGRGRRPLLSFIITCRHSPADIDRAVAALSELAGTTSYGGHYGTVVQV